jgi:hypothetical protein
LWWFESFRARASRAIRRWNKGYEDITDLLKLRGATIYELSEADRTGHQRIRTVTIALNTIGALLFMRKKNLTIDHILTPINLLNVKLGSGVSVSKNLICIVISILPVSADSCEENSQVGWCQVTTWQARGRVVS